MSPYRGPVLKGSPFVLKACGFILNLQADVPQQYHSEWRLISRRADVACGVQFGQAAKRKPVGGLLRLLRNSSGITGQP